MFSPTKLVVTEQILDNIFQDSLQRFPIESCGFLIGSRGYFATVTDSKIAENIENKINRYTINPYEYYQLEKSLEPFHLSIIGFYHSHPNGSANPSKIDIKQAWNNFSYLIVSLKSQDILEIKSWNIDSQTETCVEQAIIIIKSGTVLS